MAYSAVNPFYTPDFDIEIPHRKLTKAEEKEIQERALKLAKRGATERLAMELSDKYYKSIKDQFLDDLVEQANTRANLHKDAIVDEIIDRAIELAQEQSVRRLADKISVPEPKEEQ